MHIHFVCSGNTFRSRLAEAYLKSKNIRGLRVTSSGVKAHENKNGPITWYAARLIKHHDLVHFMSHGWTRTTQEFLKDADIVIFMDKKHHHHGQKDLGFSGKRYEIWNIPDLGDLGLKGETGDTHKEDLDRIRASDKIYEKIKRKVDKLFSALSE